MLLPGGLRGGGLGVAVDASETASGRGGWGWRLGKAGSGGVAEELAVKWWEPPAASGAGVVVGTMTSARMRTAEARCGRG